MRGNRAVRACHRHNSPTDNHLQLCPHDVALLLILGSQPRWIAPGVTYNTSYPMTIRKGNAAMSTDSTRQTAPTPVDTGIVARLSISNASGSGG